jgi:predicted aconitase with swiveling domain
MAVTILGKPIVRGVTEGEALVSDEPLSFWGGYDYQTGEITDRRHPLSGKNAANRILVLPFSKGSSTTTAILLESINAGTAPAGIVTSSVDTFFALASIVAKEMYARWLPIIVVEKEDYNQIRDGDVLNIFEDGTVEISRLVSG